MKAKISDFLGVFCIGTFDLFSGGKIVEDVLHMGGVYFKWNDPGADQVQKPPNRKNIIFKSGWYNIEKISKKTDYIILK